MKSSLGASKNTHSSKPDAPKQDTRRCCHKTDWLGKINRHRLGIQWFTCLGLSTIFLFIPKTHDFFNGLEIFIPISAVGVFDPTIGGHVRKLLDRVSGVVGALLAASVVLVPLGLSGLDSIQRYPWLKWLMYAQAISIAFYWGFWKEIYPRHPSLQYVGITASMSIYIMTSDKYLGSMWRVTLANFIGVCIGAMAFRFVLPKRARLLIRSDLVKAMDKLALILQPLVEFEAGIVKSPSFFRRKIPRSGSFLTRMITAPLSRMGSLLGNNGSMRPQDSSVGRTGSSLRKTNNRQASAHLEDEDIGFEELSGFRDEVWTQIEAVYTLLSAQDPLIRPAEREYSHKPPYKFPSAQYKEVLCRTRRLFYHTVSLFLILDAQNAVASTAFPAHARHILGDHLAWAGAVKIRRQHDNEEDLDSAIRHHFIAVDEPLGSTPMRLSVVDDFQEPQPDLASVPILKWAGVYSPLIGSAARHVAGCIAKMALCLQQLRMSADVHDDLRSAEHAMHLVGEERKHWQALVERMYTDLLLGGQSEETLASTLTEIEQTIMRRLMGVRLDEYCRLDIVSKKRLWNSFGSCVDRLAITSRTMLALVVELAACVSALEALIQSLRPVCL